MKRLFSVFLCFLFLFSFSVSAIADTIEETATDLEPITDNTGIDNVLLNNILTGIQDDISSLVSDVKGLNDTVTALSTDVSTLQSSQVESADTTDEINPSLSEDLTLVGVNSYSLNPITPSETSGLKSVILSLIGDYDAVVVEYSYQNSNGYMSYVREIQPDYVFLCSCGIFLVIIYCTFRIGGALLRG